ncbi:MAG: NAD(P)-dependent glycerol-3-phosphate dehydrogenase [Oscillospiraceae bacterium]|nr:NAD(P)-dependent glycerol-3-phosphate dehydrogenase [Oscillospiraceae bacterium]
MSKIGILGAGTWGMALAQALQEGGHQVTVWSALGEEIDGLSATRKHPNLPGMAVSPQMGFTKQLRVVCEGKELLLFAVPSAFVRGTAAAAAAWIPDGQLIVDVAKGMETGTLYTMTQVIRSELDKTGRHSRVRLVALSGPTHAEEVAVGMPSAIVAACGDLEAARRVQAAFDNTCLRVYTNVDVLGVELCGALKNVMALAAGICAGLGYGDNTRAALITRGMAEIARLGRAMGCLEQTFYGLSGIGDLIVTATSAHSRNNKAGYLIGQGLSPEQAAEQVGMVVEGLHALPAAVELAEKYKVEMPIVTAMDDVIHQRTGPREAVLALMGRERKTELPHPPEGGR